MLKKTLAIFIQLAAVGFLASSAYATEAPKLRREQSPLCQEFHKIFSDKIYEGFREFTGVTGEDPRAKMTGVTAYRDKEHLYLLYFIRDGVDKYQAMVQIYPTVELIKLVKDQFNGKQELQEMKDFYKTLELVRSDKWNVGSQIYKSENRCQSLNTTIPGEEFFDGANRKFIRHYPMGKRSTTGRLICEFWNYDANQLHFYDSFLPRQYDMEGVKVYWDPEYPGASTGDNFKYVCNVGKFVQARVVKVEVEPERTTNTKTYLESKGVLGVANLDADELKWETQVLRNIVEGQEYWNINKTEGEKE